MKKVETFEAKEICNVTYRGIDQLERNLRFGTGYKIKGLLLGETEDEYEVAMFNDIDTVFYLPKDKFNKW